MWTLGAILSGRLPFSFFPPLEADYVAAKLTMPQGTPVLATRRAVAQIAGAVVELRQQLAEEYPETGQIILHVQSSIGNQPFSSRSGPPSGADSGPTGSHLGEIVLALTESEEREISTRDVADRCQPSRSGSGSRGP